MAELLGDVELFPQVLINVRLAQMSDWKNNARLVAESQSVERSLAGEGRVLIRASGTEPVLRVMVEARESARAHEAAQRLAEVAKLA